MKNIFFNSSMPRSCSTLLQNILNQNPTIYGTGTDGSLELLYGARTNYTTSPEFKANDSEQMLRAWRGFCKQGLQGYCESLTDRPNVCIKSRGIGIHYAWYSAFMGEDIKVICMVRNLKSIFSSMEKIFRTNQESHQNIQNHSQMSGTTTAKRIDAWVASQPVGLALERFNQMLLDGTYKKCLFVKAEDLATSPDVTMQNIYQYVNLPYFQHDFNNVQQITKEDDSVYGLTPTLHTIKNQVKPLIPDYYDVLGKDICNWIDKTFSWYQEAFQYR